MDYMMIAANRIKNRLGDDGDAFIVIDGEEGSGKSSFMLRFCKMIDPDFDLDHVVYRKGKLVEAVYRFKKKSAIAHDELGLDAYKRRAMSRSNVELKQASMVWRDQTQAVVACIPCFWDLDPGLIERTYLWVHIVVKEKEDGHLIRGIAEFHYGKRSKWETEKNWDEVCSQEFEMVPPEIYKVYKANKAKAIQEALTEENKDEEEKDWRGELIQRMTDLGYTQKEQGEILGTAQSRISQLLKKYDNKSITAIVR